MFCFFLACFFNSFPSTSSQFQPACFLLPFYKSRSSIFQDIANLNPFFFNVLRVVFRSLASLLNTTFFLPPFLHFCSCRMYPVSFFTPSVNEPVFTANNSRTWIVYNNRFPSFLNSLNSYSSGYSGRLSSQSVVKFPPSTTFSRFPEVLTKISKSFCGVCTLVRTNT